MLFQLLTLFLILFVGIVILYTVFKCILKLSSSLIHGLIKIASGIVLLSLVGWIMFLK